MKYQDFIDTDEPIRIEFFAGDRQHRDQDTRLELIHHHDPANVRDMIREHIGVNFKAVWEETHAADKPTISVIFSARLLNDPDLYHGFRAEVDTALIQKHGRAYFPSHVETVYNGMRKDIESMK